MRIVHNLTAQHSVEKKTGNFGLCSAFSFYPTKILGCYGDGGAIITNSKKIYEKAKKFRNYGEKSKYNNEFNGFNSRLDEIQAAILNTKINFLDRWINKRNNLAEIYINNLKVIKPLKKNKYGFHAYHLFVCTTRNRNSLTKYLKTRGINTIVHYPFCISDQKAFLYQKKEKFINSKKLSNSVISLPMHPWLKEGDVTRISNIINQFAKYV